MGIDKRVKIPPPPPLNALPQEAIILGDTLKNNKSELRKRAEKETAFLTESLDTLTPEEVTGLVHDLQVHKIELEMQNEELRRAQEELLSARSHYANLYDLAPVGYCTLNEKGIILEANLTLAAFISIPRANLIEQPLTRFIYSEDQDAYYLYLKKLLAADEIQELDLQIKSSDKTFLWVHLKTRMVKGEDGSRQWLVTVSDISRRKKAEDEVLLRFKETKRQNIELEGFNRAMVDRELKMIELKKLVNELCVRVGEPPRFQNP